MTKRAANNIIEKDFEALSTSPRKLLKKSNPIQQLTDGEVNQAILLKIVTMEARQLQHGPIFYVVATDGCDFVQVEAMYKNTERMIQAIKPTDKGKFCFFDHIQVKNIKPEFNYGTVAFALRIREETTFSVMDTCKDLELSTFDEQHAFFEHLKQRCNFDLRESGDNLIQIKSIRAGEINGFTKLKIENILQPFSYKMATLDFYSRVSQFSVSQENTKMKLAAWNIDAEFLEKFLKDGLGCHIICKNLRLKTDSDFGPQLTFGRNTKIVLLDAELQSGTNAPTSLLAIVKGDLSGRHALNIKLQLLEEPAIVQKGKQVAIAIDGKHKCQFFVPPVVGMKIGMEFKLLGASIEKLPSGLLNLTAAESDIQKIPGFALTPEMESQLPKKYAYEYPSVDILDEDFDDGEGNAYST